MLKSWLQRIFGSPKKASETASVTPELIAEIHQHIDASVAGGFATKDEIIESVVDIYGDDYGDPVALSRQASQLATEALRSYALKQDEWSKPTDCDRLDAAFAALEAEGIISRQNFTCCGTCGAAEIWDEIEAAREAGKPARGYAFYHMQDTEAAVDGHGIYLAYGACDEGPEAAISVGREIVAHLKQHDIQTHWDGQIERRIGVSLDWKRRRHNLQA